MEEIYDDFYVIADYLIEKYGNIYYDSINTSLLNIVLVLAGARTACIIDSIRTNSLLLNELLEIVVDNYYLTVSRLTDVEYLVFLTDNKDLIDKENNMGKLLGYCYTKPDFGNTNIKRVAVEYLAISKISGYENKLFITVIPEHSYHKKSIQQCISDTFCIE